MEDIVIVAATRTAVGKFGGTLAKTPAPDLGAAVVVELLKRARLSGEQIGELIFGQVLTAGAGQNPARQTVIKSGLPVTVPALTINAVCGSGLKAVMLAAQAVRDGTRRSGRSGPGARHNRRARHRGWLTVPSDVSSRVTLIKPPRPRNVHGRARPRDHPTEARVKSTCRRVRQASRK